MTEPRKISTKRWFYGTLSCSETLFTVLNRMAGVEMVDEEQACHPLAGGLLRKGYACGQLWGAALAAGSRAREKFDKPETASAAALVTSAALMEEFSAKFGQRDCRDLIEEDLTRIKGRLRYVMSNKPNRCAKIAVEWAPVAYSVIEKSLDEFDEKDGDIHCGNCVVKAVKKMSADGIISTEDAVIVSGFAGGIGLKGNACGVLAAAIFCLGLNFYRGRVRPRDSRYRAAFQELFKTEFTPPAAWMVDRFEEMAGAMLCPVVSENIFTTPKEHSDYVAGGGCAGIITETSEIFREASVRQR